MSTSVPTGDPGTILDRGYVEQNTLLHVSTWMIPYLANVERTQNPPIPPRSLAPPESYDVVTEFTRFPEDSLPFVAVVSNGIDPNSIRREGDGMLTMAWSIAVGAVVSAGTAKDAKALAGYYGAAIRGIMLDMPQLGGWASFTDLADEQYDDIPRSEERQLAASRLAFTVEVEGVMNVYQGFKTPDGTFTPPTDPYDDPTQYPVVPDVDHINEQINGVNLVQTEE